MRLALAAFAISCVFAGGAVAHSFYDFECCSGKDCEPLPDGSVRALADGYHVAPFRQISGETVVPYGDTRLRVSPDGHFHGCEYPVGALRCLYVPPPAF